MGTALAPPLVGMAALPRVPPAERMVRKTEFVTAADVYTFTSQFMPADAPGSLPMQTYLDILAFALSANGHMLTEPLTTTNAGQIPLRPQP